jgi:effector-binding domain-containing protein
MYSISTIPEPLDDRVKMVEIKSRRMAVLRFSGRAGAESVKKLEDELLHTLKENGMRTRGTPVLMRYNGPGTPGFLRHNEVAVEIEDLAPIQK